jgi:hypothetical protein
MFHHFCSIFNSFLQRYFAMIENFRLNSIELRERSFRASYRKLVRKLNLKMKKRNYFISKNLMDFYLNKEKTQAQNKISHDLMYIVQNLNSK